MSEELFLTLINAGTPVIFAFHDYVRIIHDLVYGRPNPARFHVRGFMDEGTTPPFDMVVLNQMSRFHPALEAVKRIPKLRDQVDEFNKKCEAKLSEHNAYICSYLDDIPEIKNWKWSK